MEAEARSTAALFNLPAIGWGSRSWTPVRGDRKGNYSFERNEDILGPMLEFIPQFIERFFHHPAANGADSPFGVHLSIERGAVEIRTRALVGGRAPPCK